MRALSALRSVAADPRRRLVGVLAIAVLMVGVVTMHAMSGSPTAHSATAHGTTAHSTTTTSATAIPGQHVAAGQAAPAPTAVPCADGCGAHEIATAMCLMVLVTVLALALPGRSRLRLAAVGRAPRRLPPARALAAGGPSLHALGISRT
jgi:hypothetical protein